MLQKITARVAHLCSNGIRMPFCSEPAETYTAAHVSTSAFYRIQMLVEASLLFDKCDDTNNRNNSHYTNFSDSFITFAPMCNGVC